MGGIIEMDGAEAVEQEEEVYQPVGNASQVPVPKGYKILIALPSIEETTEGGIIKPREAMDNERISTVVGYVISMGDLCYADEVKFPTGPWCKKGDYVVIRAFSGTRINIHGQEFRIINDDTVEAVVDDPRGIRRA